MKTIRLLFLFAWALALSHPKASAQNFQVSAGSISFPVLTVSAADTERDEAATCLTIRSASFADRLVDLSHQATDTWRQFVNEWLANREKMWIWMFLLLLLLARL